MLHFINIFFLSCINDSFLFLKFSLAGQMGVFFFVFFNAISLKNQLVPFTVAMETSGVDLLPSETPVRMFSQP